MEKAIILRAYDGNFSRRIIEARDETTSEVVQVVSFFKGDGQLFDKALANLEEACKALGYTRGSWA